MRPPLSSLHLLQTSLLILPSEPSPQALGGVGAVLQKPKYQADEDCSFLLVSTAGKDPGQAYCGQRHCFVFTEFPWDMFKFSCTVLTSGGSPMHIRQ